MFTSSQLERYAEVLLWGLKTARKKKFRKNDIILLQYDPPALPLAEVLYGMILDMGAHPVQRMAGSFRMEHAFYRKANPKQLTFRAPGDKEIYENINGRIFLRAPESLTHLKQIDPGKIGRFLVSRKPLRDIMDRREEQGLYSWTLCTYPTGELASFARISVEEYLQQVIMACYLDQENPVSEWETILKQAKEIKSWLTGMKVKYLRIESDNIDLRITPGQNRKWAGISGHNIPSFELFFSPDWRGTEGTYYADLPSFRSGNLIEGIRILFTKGRAVKITADAGEEFAQKQAAMDKGACKIGEFSLTDRRFSRIDRFMADTLYDENYGGKYGNCHIALGASYTDTYAGNPAQLTTQMKKELGFNDSALHWDLVNTEDKTVTARLTNGKDVAIYEKGRFCY